MKSYVGMLMIAIALSGCAAEPTFETIGNVWANTTAEELPASIEFGVPDDTQMEVMESNGSCRSYQIGEWMLWTEILDGGDIQETMQILTGMENPEMISHPSGAYQCYESVWTVTEEAGESVVRTGVIPKGAYHYCLSMKAPSAEAQQMGEAFRAILENVYLNDTDS